MEKRGTLDEPWEEGIFVGYVKDRKGWMVRDLLGGYHFSDNVIFNKNRPGRLSNNHRLSNKHRFIDPPAEDTTKIVYTLNKAAEKTIIQNSVDPFQDPVPVNTVRNNTKGGAQGPTNTVRNNVEAPALPMHKVKKKFTDIPFTDRVLRSEHCRNIVLAAYFAVYKVLDAADDINSFQDHLSPYTTAFLSHSLPSNTLQRCTWDLSKPPLTY